MKLNVLLLMSQKDLLNYYKCIIESTLDDCQIFLATSGKKALSLSEKHPIDLMVLDQELTASNAQGLYYAGKVKKTRTTCDFIVFSKYTGSLKAAETIEPFYVFMKPVRCDYLSRKLQEWQLLRSLKDQVDDRSIKLDTDLGFAIVPLNKIVYMMKVDRKVQIRTKKRSYLCRGSLRNMMDKLDERFYHVHQSYILNIAFVENVEHQVDRTLKVDFFGLEEGAIVSRYKAKPFLDAYKNRV